MAGSNVAGSYLRPARGIVGGGVSRASVIGIDIPGQQGATLLAPTGPVIADVIAGQPVMLSATPPGLMPASSAVFAQGYVEGLARETVQAGYPVAIERDSLTLGDWTAITGSTVLAIGRDYFLTPNGVLSLLPDVAQGHCTVRVARAISATTLVLDTSPPFLN